MVPDPQPAADPDRAADACAESLLVYQGVVVHDLRGDLNGLLLTVDFLRRQLGSRPDVGPQIAETLGDIDRARDGLLRTLNQLEMVGHARRIAGGRSPGERSDQNLGEVVADVAKHQVGDRARRRQVELVLPPPVDVTVTADPVLIQLVVQRLMQALVDLGRQTELRATVARLPGQRAALHVTLADLAQFPPDLPDRLAAAAAGQPSSATVVAALTLAGKLAAMLGGAVVPVGPDEGGGFRLELPAGAGGDAA